MAREPLDAEAPAPAPAPALEFEHVPEGVRVPFRAPVPWLPVFTVSMPWAWFRIPTIEIEGVEPETVWQVSREVASWLLFPADVQVKSDEDIDSERAPKLAERLPKVAKEAEAWRKAHAEEPQAHEAILKQITDVTTALLDQNDGGGGGADDEDDEEEEQEQAEGEEGEDSDADGGAGKGSSSGEGEGSSAGGENDGDAGAGSESEGEGGDPKEAEGEDGEGEGAEIDMEVEVGDIQDSDADDGESELPEPGEEEEDGKGAQRETLSKLLPSQRNHGTAGADLQIDPRKLDVLADRFANDPRWSKFLDLIGRLSSDAWAPPARTPTAAREDVLDLELGDDISRMLSSEIMRFGIPELAALAYADFVERRMLQLQMIGSEPQGRGPIMVGLDLSTSMGDPSNLGSKSNPLSLLEVAIVLTLAIIRIGDVQKRRVLVVGFAHKVQWVRRILTPAHAVDAMLFLTSSVTAGGGTAFDGTLQTMADESFHFPGGDVLMITDGEANVAPSIAANINALRKVGKLRVFSLLLIGGKSDLVKVSDRMVRLTSEHDLETLGQQIAQAPAVAQGALAKGARAK